MDDSVSMLINTLVLHRIVDDKCELFEDVKRSTLQRLTETPDIQFCSIDTAFSTDRSIGKCICLTFDDGHVSDWEVVLPMLDKNNIKATFFVVTDWIGKSGYMSNQQIRELHDAGMQIGSHSVNHPNFLTLNSKDIDIELKKSRSLLEDMIGDSVTSFSIPFGFGTREMAKKASDAGYQYCFGSHHGLVVNRPDLIPRNSINSSVSGKNIRRIIEAKHMMRFKWLLEDLLKGVIKNYLLNLYPQLRALLLGKTYGG